MDLSLFRESLDKHRDGTPVHIGDATFIVRRWGTPESQSCIKDIRRALFGPFHRDRYEDEKIVLGEWLVEYGVVDWENVFETEVSPLKYSKKAARGVFTNPEYYYSLNPLLVEGAMDYENFLYEEADEDAEALKKK